jgi:hypothetical protein
MDFKTGQIGSQNGLIEIQCQAQKKSVPEDTDPERFF